MSNLALYIITVLIWGSTWFAIEFQLGKVEPEVSIAYRYAIASIVLFAWCRVRGLRLRFRFRDHAWFLMLGVFLFGLNYVLAYRAQIYITSALTAIAFSTMVWMNIINARIFFGTTAGLRVLSGSLLGIAGIVTLFAPQIRDLSLSDTVFYGSALAVLGALVASFGNMVSQAAQRQRLPIIQSNAWGMFYGAVITGMIVAAEGHPFSFDVSAAYVVSLAYLSIFGSIIAFGAYLTLLGRIGADRAGYAVVMFPVVALVLSAVFEGLEIDVGVIIGTALVLTGNVFVLRKPEPRPHLPRVAEVPIQPAAGRGRRRQVQA
jgi:drug/metabolite transporter (DMT)-like permease